MTNANNTIESFNVPLNTKTLFVLSTSGRQWAIQNHNTSIQKLNMNLAYYTFDREVSAESYAGSLKSVFVRGGAVTGQGLKTNILPFLDKIDDVAKNMNAVNTVVNENGKLHGYNTDAFGFETALRKNIENSKIEIRTAAVYGYGGVSNTAIKILKKLGVKVTVVGRDQNKVLAKISELDLSPFTGPFDLVVNATPASSLPLNDVDNLLETLNGCKMIFDHCMPEKDGKTNNLRTYSTENGIFFVDGIDMYNQQMIKQWSLFLNNIDGVERKISEDDIIKAWGIKL